ncbi:unnamed protein product, partial [Closterium sp. NIES-53]
MESPFRPARNAAVCLCFAVALLLVVLVLSTDPPCTSRGLSTLEFSSFASSFGCNFPILSPIASLVSSSLLPFPPPTLAYSTHGATATPSARPDSPSHATIRDPLDRASHSSQLRRPSPSHGVGDASAILPEYLGHVATGGEGLAWGDRCFEQVTARMAVREGRLGRTGGGGGLRGGEAVGRRKSVRHQGWDLGEGEDEEARARRREMRGEEGGREWVVEIQREPEAEGEGGSDGARVRAVDGRQAAATVTLSPRGKRRMLCTAVYALATPFHLVVRVLPLALPHPITVPWPPMGPLETDYVQQQGVAVFRLPHGLWGAVTALLQLLPLASDSSVGEAAQLRFLQQHMHASFHPHVPLAPPPDLSLPASTAFLSSGDLLLTSKFRGPWGLFETIEKWVTGSYAAHAALLLRTDAARVGAVGGGDVGDGGEGVGEVREGELWVAESGRISVAGRPEIAVERFSEWWRRMQRDPSGQHVVVLRLGEEGRRR